MSINFIRHTLMEMIKKVYAKAKRFHVFANFGIALNQTIVKF